MKPIKNHFFCHATRRYKMLFESESKADNFIKFNKENFIEEGKTAPVRSYYCAICGGWHVTSKTLDRSGERFDRRDRQLAENIDNNIEHMYEESFAKKYSDRIGGIVATIRRGAFDEAENRINVLQTDLDEYIETCHSFSRKLRARGKMEDLRRYLETYQNVSKYSNEELHAIEEDDITYDNHIRKFAKRLLSIRRIENSIEILKQIEEQALFYEKFEEIRLNIELLKGVSMNKTRIRLKQLLRNAELQRTDKYKDTIQEVISLTEQIQVAFDNGKYDECHRMINHAKNAIKELHTRDENIDNLWGLLNKWEYKIR